MVMSAGAGSPVRMRAAVAAVAVRAVVAAAIAMAVPMLLFVITARAMRMALLPAAARLMGVKAILCLLPALLAARDLHTGNLRFSHGDCASSS